MSIKSKYRNNIIIYNDYVGEVNVRSLCITFYKQLMGFIEQHPSTQKVTFKVKFSNEFTHDAQVIDVRNLFVIREEKVTTTRHSIKNRRWSSENLIDKNDKI